MSNAKSYKDTLNLPKTEFPMRANLANREPAAVEQWTADDVYATMLERRSGAPTFVFHDGPPYANGNIHHGHILNKVLKDFVVKYRNMAGFQCAFIPGWDCHGLPIEHNVDKKLGKRKREMTKVEVRQECRTYADEYVGIQRDEFRRLMVLADWDNPYKTMDYGYEAQTVRELGKAFDRGLVYQGLKPVHWDWAAQTALAEAEVEYASFTTEHVYVKFPFADLPQDLAASVPDGAETFVVIWTTTPWTLPANLAIALNPGLDYELVQVGDEVYVMAKELKGSTLKACRIDEADATVLASFKGIALVVELHEGRGLKARHPFRERDSVLLPADYVTTEQGTGCVHTAPGHGQEDYVLGLEHGLDVLAPVNQYGKFMEAEVPEFANMHVFKANPEIAQMLHDRGLLLNQPGDKVTIDRYPHGWRSKKPVIFRATTQWFIAMEPEGADNDEATYGLRERALAEIDTIDWLPAWGRNRIFSMVEGRPDWCISRQRSWGVPITAMHCNDCGHVVANKELADHVADLVEEQGVDVWFALDAKELMPESQHQCPGCGGDSFSKEEDILDVWWDSGVSWSAVLGKMLGHDGPADLYLEGSDQHRGWFQSSLMASLLSRDHTPYKTCLTHGFIMDENGSKYSKSSKNFEPPEKMLKQYGAEVMRFWVASSDYRGDIMLGNEPIKGAADAYRKVRNTVRFMLGNLDGFDPAQHMVPLDELEQLDRWMLAKVGQALGRIHRAFEEYQFHTIYHTLVGLMTVELSNVFLDVSKDRMYCERPDSPRRRSGQTAFWLATEALVRAMAPLLSFTAQEAWELMPKADDAPQYVFWADFPKEAADAWSGLVDHDEWDAFLAVRTEVNKALEAKRGPKKDKRPDQIGSSMEADVTIEASGETLELLRRFEDHLVEYFIVAHVDLKEGLGDLTVTVEPSGHKQCPRCRNFWVPPSSADGALCSRCASVLAG